MAALLGEEEVAAVGDMLCAPDKLSRRCAPPPSTLSMPPLSS